jgi:lysophospholipase L1-like esterase
MKSHEKLLALSVLILCGASAGCRSSHPPPASPRPPAGIETFGTGPSVLRYLVLGDSTAVGVGGTYENGIARQTSRHLSRRGQVLMKNVAVSGARVADVLEDQLPRIGDFRPDLVLLDVGANDVIRLTSAASLARDLEEIYRELVARNCGVRIVVTGAPDMSTPPRIPRLLRGIAGRRTAALNEEFEKFVARRNLVFAPIARETGPLFKRDRSLFDDDRFHPNDRGYATWIEVIEPALDRALAQPSRCA